jgi:hypothetical protein
MNDLFAWRASVDFAERDRARKPARITPQKAATIRAWLAAGTPPDAVARLFRVDLGAVLAIKRGGDVAHS